MSVAPLATATPVPRSELYRGTGIAKRSLGRPLTDFIQKRRPSTSRKKKFVEEVVIDLGAKLGICRRCTCPVHEADITDGYAEACAEGGFECIQEKWSDSCKEYAEGHREDVANLADPAWAWPAEKAGETDSDGGAPSPSGPEVPAEDEADDSLPADAPSPMPTEPAAAPLSTEAGGVESPA